MLGQYGLFPFLKGWEYKTHTTSTRTVRNGADPIEVIRATNDFGWLQLINFSATDCLAGFEITYQGGELEPQIFSVTPHQTYIAGAVGLGDPAGYVQLYYRPLPSSTYGAYYMSLTSLGYYGGTLPYLPTVIVKLFLESASTQETAESLLFAQTIHITEKKDFIRSLRKVLGTKNMVIDPALLRYGRTLLNELNGEDWKQPKPKED